MQKQAPRCSRMPRWLPAALVAILGIAGSPNAVADSECNWCESYRSLGKLYRDEQNTWVQAFNVVGRFQFQGAHVDGSAGEQDFDYSRGEVRRFYVGAGARILDVWQVSGQAVIFRDTIGERSLEFQHMWDLTVRLDAARAFGWSTPDKFTLGFGAREVNVSEEWNVSSKKIKTVERSALANKIWPSDLSSTNPTGFYADWQAGRLASTVGIFTTTTADYWAGWNDGRLYYLKLRYDGARTVDAGTAEFLWTAYYQDVSEGDEALAGGVEWATSLSTRYGRDAWLLRVEAIAGKNGKTDGRGNLQAGERQGNFRGVVLYPSLWLQPDRLELVARLQWATSSESQGLRLNSRYSRRADQALSDIDLPGGGRGDEHRSLYLGANRYFCGDNLKLMLGVEHDDMTVGGETVFKGWTAALAFRTYF